MGIDYVIRALNRYFDRAPSSVDRCSMMSIGISLGAPTSEVERICTDHHDELRSAGYMVSRSGVVVRLPIEPHE